MNDQPTINRGTRRLRPLLKTTAVIAVLFFGAVACSVEDSDSSTPTPAAPSTTTADGTAPSGDTTDDPAPSGEAKPDEPELTVSQENAVQSAKDYLSMDSGFSEKGLIDQLSSNYGDGFPKKDAEFAVKYLKIDWNEQAVLSAKGYLDMGGFSCKGLVDQLSSSYGENFTKAQATYAAKKVGLC